MSLLAVSLLQKIRFYARNLSRLHILLLKQTLFAITIQHNDAIVRARRHYTASLLAAATIQKRALLRIIIHFCLAVWTDEVTALESWCEMPRYYMLSHFLLS